MTAFQRVLDGIGRRFIAWGTVLRQHDAPGSPTDPAWPPPALRPERWRPAPPWLPANGEAVRRPTAACMLRTPWMAVLSRLRRPATPMPKRHGAEPVRAHRPASALAATESRGAVPPLGWPPVATPPGPPETWWPATSVVPSVQQEASTAVQAPAISEPISAPLRYDYGAHRRRAPIVWPVGTEEPVLPRRRAFDPAADLPEQADNARVAPFLDAAPPRAASALPCLEDMPARPGSERPPWPMPTAVDTGIDALARERRQRVDDEQRG